MTPEQLAATTPLHLRDAERVLSLAHSRGWSDADLLALIAHIVAGAGGRHRARPKQPIRSGRLASAIYAWVVAGKPAPEPLPPTPPEARLSDTDYAQFVQIEEHGRQALALRDHMQAQQNGHRHEPDEE